MLSSFTLRRKAANLFTLGLGCLWLGFGTLAQAQTPIRISVQPANYGMLTMHVATLNGYWKEMGLAPTFVLYPAGLPQVKAHADWDVGITGAVPSLIAARDFKMLTIAIGDNQSRTNGLMAKKELIQKIREEKTVPDGTKIALTLNSTADYAAQVCLALWGGKIKSDMQFIPGSQAEVMQAGIEGRAEILGLWAPNIYTMKEKHGYDMLCTAKDFGSGVYNAVVTNREFAKTKPEVVKAFLAVMLRSVNWIKANPEKAQAFFVQNAKKEGVDISPAAAKSDFELRPLFNLDEQLEVMGGSPDKLNDSPSGRSFFAINVFLTEGKAGSRNMRPVSFMDISFIQQLKADPKLAAFANSR